MGGDQADDLAGTADQRKAVRSAASGLQDRPPRVLVEEVGRLHVLHGDLLALPGSLGAGSGRILHEGEEVGELPVEPCVFLQTQHAVLSELHVAHACLGDVQDTAQRGLQDRPMTAALLRRYPQTRQGGAATRGRRGNHCTAPASGPAIRTTRSASVCSLMLKRCEAPRSRSNPSAGVASL